MKKIFSLLLCLIIATLFSASASAIETDESAIQPKDTYSSNVDAKIELKNTGAVIFTASAKVDKSYMSSVTIKLYAQRRLAGSSASWTVFKFKSSSGASSFSVTHETDYMSNYEYRTYALFTFKLSDGTETSVYKYSPVIP